jgi:CRISPR system Cascade subunit CasB
VSHSTTVRQRHTWEGFSPTDPDAGQTLADLRSGLGRPAGDAPELWRYYTTLNTQGHRTAALEAEHTALTLFGLHQQSHRTPMHKNGVGVGQAALELYLAENANQKGIDGRMKDIATSTDTDELTGHLRGLVQLLHGHGEPLDYTRLFWDLRTWNDPQRRTDTRLRWASQYENWHKRNPSNTSDNT